MYIYIYIQACFVARDCIELQLVLFLSVNWILIGTPGLVSIIIVAAILHIRVGTSTIPRSTLTWSGSSCPGFYQQVK